MGSEELEEYLKNVIGLKYNMLTIVRVDDKSKYNKEGVLKFPSKWKYICECGCGNEVSTDYYNLKYGHIRSCGCIKKYPKYLNQGDKFGRLTVLSKDYSYEHGNPSHWKYRCQCVCGTFVSVEKRNLVSGASKSCGCYNKDRIKQTHKKYNKINICGDTIEVYFFNKDHGSFLIDANMYHKIKEYCWRMHSCGYAVSTEGGSNLYLHRLLCNPPDGMDVDHINRNKLDNRMSNLRVCTHRHNSMNKNISPLNKSGVNGVHFDKKSQKWRAEITDEHGRVYLGVYSNFDEAVQVRKNAEIKYFGEFTPKHY